MVLRVVVGVLVLCSACRSKPPPASLPEATFGTFGNDAGASKGLLSASFDTASFSVDYAVASSRACLVFARVRGTTAAPGCSPVIGTAEMRSDAGAGMGAWITLRVDCVDGNKQSSTSGVVYFTCDFKSDPTVFHVSASNARLRIEETTHPALAPLVSAAERAELERPVTFPKRSADLTEEMGRLVVKKADLLLAHPDFTYWVVGTADDFPNSSDNRDLSEKRAKAVMAIFDGRIADKKRVSFGFTGNFDKRGAGVFFDLKLRE